MKTTVLHRTRRALWAGFVVRAETGGECVELGRRHLLLDALEEDALFGANVSPEAFAERGQPFVETRRGVAAQVPHLCPHVVVLTNEVVDELSAVTDVLYDGGEQMSFFGVEVGFKGRLDELDEQVHLPSSVRRPGSPRRRRATQNQPLRENKGVVMLARQGNKTLMALHDKDRSSPPPPSAEFGGDCLVPEPYASARDTYPLEGKKWTNEGIIRDRGGTRMHLDR